MGGLDAMRETYGGAGLPADLAIIVAAAAGICLLLSFLCMLGEAAGRPDTWPAIVGGFGFWAVLLAGRPMLAFLLMIACLAASSYLGALRERRLSAKAQRRPVSVPNNDR
jgi:hypothetical protein